MCKFARLTFFMIFLFVFSNSYGQDKRIDSIKVVFRNPKVHDTTKLNQLDHLLRTNYNQNNPNYYYIVHWMGWIAHKTLKENTNVAVRKRANMHLGTYYNGLAIEAFMKGRIDKSVAFEDKAIAVYKAEKDYDEMYYQYVLKAQFLSRINESEKAISCLFAALKHYDKDKKKNLGEIAYATSILGNIYALQKKFKESIVYFEKVAGYYDHDTRLTTMERNYLKAANYGNAGDSYQQLSNFDAAVENYNKAIALTKLNGDMEGVTLLQSKMAAVKIDQKKYDEAEKICKELLLSPIATRTEAHINMQLARLYLAKSEHSKARGYAEKSFAMSKENKFLDLQEISGRQLFTISKANGDYKRALEMQEFNNKLKDSSKLEASRNALAQQQLKYDFEKKELNLKLIAEKRNAAKNNWLIGLSGMLLLLSLGGYFYYRNSRQKQAITVFEKEQIKQKLLITQMNPHFIFNSIDNIQGLIHDKKDADAVNYLTKFSKLTRQILEHSNENYISLSEEVEMIRNYLAIQQLLYNNKFDFHIFVEGAIDTEALFLPPMLTQPFIENAIKHGLANTLENGKVDIRFSLKDSKLFFEVSDNGKGFDKAKKETSHKSLAMTITRERLIGYSKNHDFLVQTDNIKDQDENVVGAKVSFEIPYVYES